jgi:integration host factor subunit beta
MTKRDLIDEVVKLFPRFSRRDAEVIVNEVFDSLTQALVRGERIEIRGFGSFVVKGVRRARGATRRPGALVPGSQRVLLLGREGTPPARRRQARRPTTPVVD